MRILILKYLYKLSDEQMEYQLLDRMSYQRFCLLADSANVPDCNTIWHYQQRLGVDGVTALLQAVDGQLLQRGYTAQGHTKTESNSQGEKRYGYNAAERLTTFSDKPAGQASAQIEASYRYDPFGQPRHDGWRSHAGHRGDARPDGCDAGSRTAPAGIASAFC